MGWKKFKEKFNIEHIIQIEGDFLLIGSGYVSNLAYIDLKTGKITDNKTFDSFVSRNYEKLAAATTEEILEVLNSPDVFSKKLSVYTYEGSKIIEEFCEEYGYPNCTHSGRLMYENSHFKKKIEALNYAKKNNKSALSFIKERILQMEKDLLKLKVELVQLKDEEKDLKNQLKQGDV